MTSAMGLGIECTTERSSARNISSFGSAGTERMTPPAIRNPKAWMG